MYELRQELTGDAETGWEYRLRFGPRVSWLRTFNREFDGRLRLVVPRGTPIEVSGSLGIGKSVLELGGLHVVGVDLDVGWGDHELRFSEPTPVPVRRIRIDGSMGKTILSGLGNASAAEVELRQRLGDVRVGLDGAWRQDARVLVRHGMGQCVIHAPDDLRVDVERGRVGMGQRKIDRVGTVGAEGPVVHLDAAVRMGGLKVER